MSIAETFEIMYPNNYSGLTTLLSFVQQALVIRDTSKVKRNLKDVKLSGAFHSTR